MALTLLELVRRAGQGEGEDGGAARVDVESAWSSRLKPTVDAKSDVAVTKGKVKKIKGVVDDFIEDLMVRESEGWGVRLPNAEEEKLVAALKKKLENVGAFSASDFVAMVSPTLESAGRQGEERVSRNGEAMENGAMEGEKASALALRDDDEGADGVLLSRVLRKGGPHLGQKLLASIVNCILGLQLWKGLKVLLESGLVTSVSHPHLVQKLVEHREADLLCMCFYYVLDLTPSDIMTALKFLLGKSNASLRSFGGVRQEWRKAASAAIDVVDKSKANFLKRQQALTMEIDEIECQLDCTNDPVVSAELEKAKHLMDERERQTRYRHATDISPAVIYAVALAAAVDGFEGWETCLHALVASGQDEAVLAAIIADLDTSEAVQLLQYFGKWLDRYSNWLANSPSPKSKARHPMHNVPSSHQVLQWVGMILDGQYTKCVMSSEFLPELRAIQRSVELVLDVGRKLTPLLGVTEHLREKHPLPAPGQDSAANSGYTIEYLDIS